MRRLLFFLFTVVSLHSYAQPRNADITAKIEKIFSRYTDKNPGCQLSVIKDGKLIFSKAWGKANLEDNTALTMNSLIEAGSVSKQFTAASILLLEQQGKLSLEDDIRKYLPELPDYGTVIKVKHLIHHTSGLKDWGTVAALTGFGRSTKTYRNEDALEITARQKTLNNIPGSQFVYSNSNYNLLAIVIQRVSGMSLADFTRQYIFIPAGMTKTQWRDNFRRVVPNRAIAYYKTGTVYEADMPNEDAYGNGGLLTTTEDLLKWNAFYTSGKFGQPSLFKKQTTLDTLNNHVFNYYAAGLLIQTTRGERVIRHNGATGSYRCYLSWFPDLNLSVAWLSNTSAFDSKGEISNAVEALFLKPAPERKAEQTAGINVPAEKLQSYTGLYRNSRTSGVMNIVFSDNQLKGDQTVLRPVAERKFRYGPDQFIFDTQKNFQWINDDGDSVDYSPVLPATSNLPVNAYTGKYFSAEADAGITIIVKNDTLFAQFNSYTSYRLQPLYRDAFRIMDFGGILNFERSGDGSVRHFSITQGRARNVGFERKD